jgi:hypothetical protein
VEEALSETLGCKVKYFVTLMTVASAGASIKVSRACVNRFRNSWITGNPSIIQRQRLAGTFMPGLHGGYTI